MEREEKEKNGKEKKRKGKRKKCWGGEVNGGGYTDERTVCKDTYLHYVGVVVMGGWVYFGSDNDFDIYQVHTLYICKRLFSLFLFF